MKKISKIKYTWMDFFTAVLSASVVFLIPLGVPLWALFLSWTWYFIIAKNGNVLKQALPAMLIGYLAGASSVFLFNLSGENYFVLALCGFACVSMLMVLFKTSIFACTIAAWNSYSCFYAAYYGNAFSVVSVLDKGAGDIKNILICVLWTAMANILGLLVGYIDVKFGTFNFKNKFKEVENIDLEKEKELNK